MNLQLEFSQPVKCYNGCFDSASQRVLDNQDEVLRLIQAKEPEARVTYFPMEQQFVVSVLPGRWLSSFCTTRGQALLEAYNRLTKPQEEL